MATQVQFRRGTTSEHGSFTGAVGEITVDTDKDTAVVHDGTAAGGRPLLREDLSNLANGSVTYARIQDVSATDRLLGRSSAGAGDVEEIICTAAGRALLDDANAAAQRTTLGLGSLATASSIATADIAADAVTYAKIQNVSATDRLLGRSSAGAGDVEEITCTAAGRALIDDADAAAQRTTLGLVIGTNVQAYSASTAFTNTAQSFSAAQRGSVSALTSAATVTADFAVANNFSLTLGHNVTLANPSNLTAGQSGAIVITQPASGGPFTVSYGSNWRFPGGTVPIKTTTASSVCVLLYYVESASRITAQLLNDVKV